MKNSPFQNSYIEKRVIRPLQQLLETFHGPNRLITKRQDKHIDFSASAQRAEKNRDPTKTKSVRLKSVTTISNYSVRDYSGPDRHHLWVKFSDWADERPNLHPLRFM